MTEAITAQRAALTRDMTNLEQQVHTRRAGLERALADAVRLARELHHAVGEWARVQQALTGRAAVQGFGETMLPVRCDTEQRLHAIGDMLDRPM